MRTVRTFLSGLFFVAIPLAISEANCGSGYPHAGTGRLAVPLLLIALGVGYWVLTLSRKEEAPLDKLGRFAGGLMMLVSFLGLLCAAICALWLGISCMRSSGMCPFGGRASHCNSAMMGHNCPPASSASPEQPASSQQPGTEQKQ
jgi:hypothetical protein